MQENVLNQLKIKFDPFNNFFKTLQIDFFISCGDKFEKDPLKFFECYQKGQMEFSNDYNFLSSKIGICDVQNSECLEKCKISFDKDPKLLDDCSSKCFSKFDVCCNFEYEEFYKKKLGNTKEWSRLKKYLN
jgi:hypothetical protein